MITIRPIAVLFLMMPALLPATASNAATFQEAIYDVSYQLGNFLRKRG